MRRQHVPDPSLVMLTGVLVFNGWRVIKLRRELKHLDDLESRRALLGVVTPVQVVRSN